MKSASVALAATVKAIAAITAKFAASFNTACDSIENRIDSAVAQGKSSVSLNWVCKGGRGRKKANAITFEALFPTLNHEGFFAEPAEDAAEDAPAVLTLTGQKMIDTLTEAGYTVELVEGSLTISWEAAGDVSEATEEDETEYSVVSDTEGFAAAMTV